MADLGIGEIALLVGAAASTGVGIAQAVKGGPKQPTPTQATKDPNIDAFRRQNSNALSPGGVLAGISSTATGTGNGSNVGTNTLLGS